MKKRSRIVLGFSTVVLILFVWAAWPRNEPSYKGRSLRRWVYDNYESRVAFPARPDDVRKRMRDRAEEAIRHIGTNGIPTLLEMLTFKGSRARGFVTSLSDNGTVPVEKIAPSLYAEEDFHFASCRAFEVLGENARPAIPALMSLLMNNDSEIRSTAENALQAITNGPPRMQ